MGASNEQGPPTLPSVEPISKSESLISSSVTSSALPASNIPANVVDHLKALSPNQTIDGDDEDDDLDKLDELDAQFSNMVAQVC